MCRCRKNQRFQNNDECDDDERGAANHVTRAGESVSVVVYKQVPHVLLRVSSSVSLKPY